MGISGLIVYVVAAIVVVIGVYIVWTLLTGLPW
jgi:hypothetical protein